jgi:glycerol uptake facilitator protein
MHDIVRGTDSSLASCDKTFGNYYMLSSNVSSWSNAVFVEAFGTAFLVLVYFAVTNEKNFLNKNHRNGGGSGGGLLVPFVIGLAYAILIVMLGSFTGPGLNPARDIGPRLITYYYGWGPVTIQGYEVYIIGPIRKFYFITPHFMIRFIFSILKFEAYPF